VTAFLERVARPCGRCPASFVFAITDAGRSMPVDVEPDVAGNVAVHVDGAGRVRARVVSKDLPVQPWEKLHLPHFATCGGMAKAPAQRQDNVVPLYRKRAARRALTTLMLALALVACSEPAAPGAPDGNTRSFIDDYGRVCTVIDPPGAAVAMDCDAPPEGVGRS
jgi:hypothetical protein